MKVLRTIAEVRAHRRGQESVGFVPTMGAFHQGHLELMRRARSGCKCVYVSLFVNPTQFGPNEDFAAYPRDEQRDLALAESAGADAVFAPSTEEMYGKGGTKVKAGKVGDKWEGAHRPGHFDGVATVVAKLFGIVQPDVAYFGLKDLQQCAVVRDMVDSLAMPVRLELVETVRDENGLALSSRNAFLTETHRKEASNLYRRLRECACEIARGIDTQRTLNEARAALESADFRVDYLSCVDPGTMEEVCTRGQAARVICAVRFHGVRLIDNVGVDNDPY